ncbi:MAG TPA: hypothetical protein VFB80_00470 [Pirellulaceae bacterium]|nr:hypothetical protein [Pirellulaceae bacterium]
MVGSRIWQLVLGCALILGLPAVSRGQALEELREDVRTNSPDPPREESPPAPRKPAYGCDHCEDDSDYGFGGLLLFAITAPFWGPPVWSGDSYSETGYFAHFPYQHDDGYMIIGPALAEGELYRWSLRGRAEYGTDFRNLEWTGGHLLLDTSSRLGLEADFRHVREDVPPGRFDSVWLGDGNIVFRFAQSELLVMRTGLGVTWLSDPADSNMGFNFTYGGDFFPIQPWIFSGELDLGTLGHTSVVHFRLTTGVNLGMTEAFLGYDYYDVGRTQIAGLVAGLRVWY